MDTTDTSVFVTFDTFRVAFDANFSTIIIISFWTFTKRWNSDWIRTNLTISRRSTFFTIVWTFFTFAISSFVESFNTFTDRWLLSVDVTFKTVSWGSFASYAFWITFDHGGRSDWDILNYS
jgi:hypothetical protein